MKKLNHIAAFCVMVSSFFLAAGCEKAAVTPVPALQAAPAAQDANTKERGMEIWVTGTYQNAPFKATLRVTDFTNMSGSPAAAVSLQQISGGLSREQANSLADLQLMFIVQQIAESDKYIQYYANNNNATYPFDPDTDAFTLVLQPYGRIVAGASPVTLSTYYAIELNASETHKWTLVAPTIAEIIALYNPSNGTALLGSGLTTDGLIELGTKLNYIASISGRH